MSVAVTLIFFAFALPIAVIDLRSFRIPDRLVFPCLAAMGVFLACAEPGVLPNRAAAAALSGLLFFVVRRFVGGLGLGDVKFALLIGLCCGLPWACVAFLAAAATGLAGALIARRGRRDKPLPFAPFLTAGVAAAFVLSQFFHFF
jgi:prepilin signal peptidase PulO-like enzyme (type II secretory pathway)